MVENNISIPDENVTEALSCPEATDAELYQLLYANWLLNGCIQLVLCVMGEWTPENMTIESVLWRVSF